MVYQFCVAVVNWLAPFGEVEGGANPVCVVGYHVKSPRQAVRRSKRRTAGHGPYTIRRGCVVD